MAATTGPGIRAAVTMEATAGDTVEDTATEATVMAGEAGGIGVIPATAMVGDAGVGDLDGDGLTGGDTLMDMDTAGALLIPTIRTTTRIPALPATTALTMGMTILHRQTPDQTPTTIPQSRGDLRDREARPARTTRLQMMPAQNRAHRFSPLTG